MTDILRNSFNVESAEKIQSLPKKESKIKISNSISDLSYYLLYLVSERGSSEDSDVKPNIKIRRRVSNIRLTKDDRPVITSAEEVDEST